MSYILHGPAFTICQGKQGIVRWEWGERGGARIHCGHPEHSNVVIKREDRGDHACLVLLTVVVTLRLMRDTAE